MALFDFLEKEHTIAGPGFNRWLVPPAALAVHLCIGMAYGFSVFWLPMSKLVAGAPMCSEFMGALSAAIFGRWLEHAGPRQSGLTAALCWGIGLAIGGYGVSIHQLWLVFLGTG